MEAKLDTYLEIQAAEAGGESRRVTGVAYTGGKIRLGGWNHPVVVDLAGMTVPEQVPLLADHWNSTSNRMGLVSPRVEGGSLFVEGAIVAGSEAAGEILAQGRAGAEWQLSIGAEADECELVDGKREINGREITGKFYHVRKSTLREVSVVAVGADRTTRMAVKAAFDLGEEPMNTEENKNQPAAVAAENVAPAEAAQPSAPAPDPAEAAENAVRAERARVASIRAICAGEFPDIEAKAVDEGWTPDKATTEVLAAVRAARPPAAPNVIVKGAAVRDARTLEAAMCLRAGIDERALVEDLGEEAVEAAYPDRDLSLRGLLEECVRAEGGQPSRSFDNDAVRAAFSTVSLPGILSNVAEKKLMQAYRAQPIIAQRLCTTGDLTDFKETVRYRLTDIGDLKPVAADGEIKDGGVTEEKATMQIDTYGKKFVLTRKMIIDDDLGAFLKIPAAMGNRAARLIDQLFFRRLLSNPTMEDGKALFHASHRNILTGATSALSADSLKKAIQAYLDQVDADGQPISVEPAILLVPTALKHLAIELTRGATLIMAGGSEQTVRPAINVLASENLEIVSSPYLANENYPGASETAWYLFGRPGTVDTFEIGYLKGRRAPTVERGETDFNTLGQWFRVYFDVGVREQDFRGMLKANGAA